MRKKTIFFVIVLIFMIVLNFKPTVFAEMAKGASIANVDVEGMSFEKAAQLLEEEIEVWRSRELIAEAEGEKIKLPTEVFIFDVNGSLKELEKKTKRSLKTFFLRPKNVHIPLKVNYQYDEAIVKEFPKHIDLEESFNVALEQAKELDNSPVTLVFSDTQKEKLEKVAEVTLNAPEVSETVIKMLVKELNEVEIEAEEVFSFLDSVRLPKKLTKSTEETSFVATALYSLVLETNLEVIERHAHLHLPEYVKPGLDAEVGVPKYESKSGYKEESEAEKNKGETDQEEGVVFFDPKQKNLILRNPNDYHFVIKTKYENKTLTMSLERIKQSDEHVYKPVVRNLEKLKPRTVERYSPKILTKETYEVEPGIEGQRIDLYRQAYDKKGNLKDEEFMNRNFYPPRPKVVLVSTLTHEEIDAREEEARKKAEEQAKKEAEELETELKEELDEIEETTEIDSVLTNEVYEEILIKMMQDYMKQKEE